MSEIGEIHEKINKVDKDLTYMVGKLDTLIPNLVTKAELARAINEHVDECCKPCPGKKTAAEKAKLTAKIVAAIGGLTAAVYALIQALV